MIEAKRSLGQNFFVNENLAKSIVESICQQKSDVIVEIGSGQGYFSSLFQKHGKKLIMIEKDNFLAKGLSEHYPEQEVVNTDFLEWDFEELEKYKSKKILFFGSLPYNVSKRIISKIIESHFFNTSSYFIIQKEVGEKYSSEAPDMTFLALKTKLHAIPKKLFDISPESFRPKPKVTSSLVEFSPQQERFFSTKEEEKRFENFLNQAFKQPRKKLSNNLKNFFPKGIIVEEKIEKILEKRPQHLTLQEYIFLFSNTAKR